MSAFICDDLHNSILGAAIVWFRAYRRTGGFSVQERKDAAAVARLLHVENVASVNDRYRETTSDECFVFQAAALQIVERMLLTASPAQTMKATARLAKMAACLEYQSCEHDGWKTSEACAELNRLRAELLGALPGAGEIWEVTQASDLAA